jgi:hypothetical protein
MTGKALSSWPVKNDDMWPAYLVLVELDYEDTDSRAKLNATSRPQQEYQVVEKALDVKQGQHEDNLFPCH